MRMCHIVKLKRHFKNIVFRKNRGIFRRQLNEDTKRREALQAMLEGVQLKLYATCAGLLWTRHNRR